MTNLFQQVTEANKANPHGWTTPEKACIIAASIVALRPRYSIEIGVYAGKGLVAMGFAHKAIGHGTAIGIDPYSAAASADGQVRQEDKDFWSKLDHEAIYAIAQEQIRIHSIQNTCKIIRCKSSEFDPPDGIGFFRCDGNHGIEATSDIMRYTPFIDRGGIAVIDDVKWKGGGVERGLEWMLSHGWRKLYEVQEPGVDGELWVALQKQ